MQESPLYATEAELVTSARGGSKTAFAGLVEIYQRAVYNLCYRMLGNAGEAEDASQEAFLRAFAQFHRYDPTRPFKTWLLSITSHYCIDRLRQRRVHYLSIDDEPLWVHPALREARPSPEEAAIRRDESERIQTLLAGLTPEHRSAVVMRYWYDLSYEEIAAMTGTTVSAVKSRLHRARLTLGQMMAPGKRMGAGAGERRVGLPLRSGGGQFYPLAA